jgi:hypothetical protein
MVCNLTASILPSAVVVKSSFTLLSRPISSGAEKGGWRPRKIRYLHKDLYGEIFLKTLMFPPYLLNLSHEANNLLRGVVLKLGNLRYDR